MPLRVPLTPCWAGSPVPSHDWTEGLILRSRMAGVGCGHRGSEHGEQLRTPRRKAGQGSELKYPRQKSSKDRRQGANRVRVSSSLLFFFPGMFRGCSEANPQAPCWDPQ